jgi:hypothetical protein
MSAWMNAQIQNRSRTQSGARSSNKAVRKGRSHFPRSGKNSSYPERTPLDPPHGGNGPGDAPREP